MSEPFIAEIRPFAINFAPNGWATCDGQLLPIAQFTALFSLLGTNYGGDGRSTFGLPNLNGRVPIGVGQGPGLSNRDLGETGGAAAVTLAQSQMPSHTHAFNVRSDVGTSTVAAGDLAAAGTWRQTKPYGVVHQFSAAPPAQQLAPLGPQAIQPAGGGQPHNTMMPYLAILFCIALQGIYPPRP